MFISITCTILFAVLLIITNGDAMQWLVMENNFDYSFTDYFRHVGFTSDMQHFYLNTKEAPFPPFAYLLYYFLYRLNPRDTIFDVEAWEEVRDYRYNMLIFVMVIIFMALIFRLLIDKVLRDNKPEINTAITAAVLCSAPFMAGAIERGNIVILVMLLVLAAFYLKDSEKAVYREIALIFIAMATGIKVYPAIMGLIYIKEKRWKEAVRLIIYCLILFFVPYIFTGGIPAMISHFKILFFFGNQSYASWTDIRNYLLSLSKVLGQYENSPYFVKYFMIIENVYLLICVLSLFKTGKEWRKALYMCGVMALYVPSSHRYVSIYMAVPLILYLKECN
ncbi:MAG: DUF2029 domain-containing protein, partial [Lachnospiraceae bacterium]|nr:DUF2029 domain-containing protein [Lachnospiraceae bacterium]